jgi:hypothetical protein
LFGERKGDEFFGEGVFATDLTNLTPGEEHSDFGESALTPEMGGSWRREVDAPVASTEALMIWARRRASASFLGILILEISGHSVGGSSSPGTRPGARGGDMMFEPAATEAVGSFHGVAFGGGGSISADVVSMSLECEEGICEILFERLLSRYQWSKKRN